MKRSGKKRKMWDQTTVKNTELTIKLIREAEDVRRIQLGNACSKPCTPTSCPTHTQLAEFQL
jgi:hypothetical protein